MMDSLKKDDRSPCIFQVQRVEDVLWTNEKIVAIEFVCDYLSDRQFMRSRNEQSGGRKSSQIAVSKKCNGLRRSNSKMDDPHRFPVKKNVKMNDKVYQNVILKLFPLVESTKTSKILLKDDWSPFMKPGLK